MRWQNCDELLVLAIECKIDKSHGIGMAYKNRLVWNNRETL